MELSAVVVLAQGGRTIPLVRTRRAEIVAAVARAGLEDVRSAAECEGDVMVVALLEQEGKRLREALEVVGVDVEACR